MTTKKKTPEPSLVLIDTQDRMKLNEGRRKGLGFGFCKKVSDKEFHTVMPISACKDYLSDIIWAEQTGLSSTFYNLAVAPTGCFKDGVGYLAGKILLYKNMTSFTAYPAYDTEVKLLAKNLDQMVACVNWFEEKVGAKGRTCVVEMAEKGTYLFTVPEYWLTMTPLISLYGWLLRVTIHGFDLKDPIDSIKAGAAKNVEDDAYYINDILPKINHLLSGKALPPHNLKGCGNPHGAGIVSYPLPNL